MVTQTADMTAEHLRPGPQVAAQLFVLWSRNDLDQPGSAHVLRGIQRVQLGRGTRAFIRRRRDGQSVLLLSIDDARVSTQHAQICRGAKSWIVEDVGSRNGTFLDGQQIKRATLSDGAIIEVGSTILLFRDALALPDASADRDETEVRGPIDRWRSAHAPLAATHRALARLAPTDLSVLIRGETGAGKERIADGLHTLSGRTGAFVAVNCATLDAALVDSTLFGHRRGAFTGAVEARAGFFRQAHGGTLFLDEVGELSAAVQARLLRVLETGEVIPVGADRAQRVDVRVVAATHRDLSNPTFRADLLARHAQAQVELPPLRDRREDLGILLRALLPEPRPRLARDAALALLRAQWPQNVRQLANTLSVAHVLADDRIERSHLPHDLVEGPIAATSPALSSEAQARRDTLIAALTATHGNVAEVARRLNRSRNSIHRWLRRFELDPESFRG